MIAVWCRVMMGRLAVHLNTVVCARLATTCVVSSLDASMPRCAGWLNVKPHVCPVGWMLSPMHAPGAGWSSSLLCSGALGSAG